MKQRSGLGIFIVLLIAAQGSLAQEVNPALERHLDDIEVSSSRIRRLDVLEPVDHAFPTHDAVRAFVRGELDEQVSPDDAAREMLFYSAFDLLPPETDLRAVIVELLADQIGGYYDPDSKVMNVVLLTDDTLGDELPLLERLIYSHEYAHALQDQHFDLNALLPDDLAESDPDRALAIQALVEGDATVVMQEYMIELSADDPFGTALQLLGQGLQLGPGGFALPPNTPPILEAELTYPYVDGLNFVMALRNSGGWGAVDAAFADPPQSTEQVIHPERYLTGDDPVAVTVNNRQSVLGADWSLGLERTMGEFYLRAYLLTQLGSAQAQRAAAGWGGDRFHIYQNSETGELAWVLRIVWDTTADAEEFYTAFLEFGGNRSNVTFVGSCWQSDTDTICLAAGDDSTTTITAAPQREQALGLLDEAG